MVRENKVEAVKNLEDLFKNANALVMSEYRGLSVSQQTKLRRDLKKAGASFNVVKMTLAKRAAENIGLESLSEHFTGPTGITVIESDPVEAAKVLKNFEKIRHKVPMLSLANAFDKDDLLNFEKKILTLSQ